MAKAKKPESKSTSSSKKKPQQSSSIVDTNLAAAAAAAMVGNKAGGASGQGGAPRKESAGFKQMKAGLNKPASSVMGNLLDNTGGQKKTNQPFTGFKQVGRNQTFGADVNRTGVPRRTSG